jgi:prenyltransferase beta subunit
MMPTQMVAAYRSMLTTKATTTTTITMTTIVQGGGFGGNPAQMPHCAPTYATILALSIVELG